MFRELARTWEFPSSSGIIHSGAEYPRPRWEMAIRGLIPTQLQAYPEHPVFKDKGAGGQCDLSDAVMTVVMCFPSSSRILEEVASEASKMRS
jgi:hypothetical protein